MFPHNLLTHNLITTKLAHHTTCSHTSCSHTTYSPHNLLTTQLAHHTTYSPHSLLAHNLLTHNLLTHNMFTHNLLTHTQHVHTQLAHTQHVHTHSFWHTAYSHTTYSHTTCSHTQLTHRDHTQHVHTQLLTQNLLTHTTSSHTQLTHHTTCSPHNLLTHKLLTHNSPHNLLTTQLARTQLAHTQLTHTQLAHTQLAHTQLVHTHLTHTVAGVALTALGWLWWRAWVWVDAVGAAAVCVAGVALGDMDRYFAWQVWHLATWTVTLPGRRGTYGTGLSLVARLGLSWRRGRRGSLRGRRGTWRHGPSLCLASVALGDMDVHFAWQAWHLGTRIVTFRGKRGTWRHGPLLCLAGVALMALGWLWWRAWVWADAVGAAAVYVAGVALGDMDRYFAWQAWHLATWTCTSRGRRGTYGTGLALVTTVSLLHTPILHHLFSLSCISHPIFLPFFCCLLEEVDMWGYPIL